MRLWHKDLISSLDRERIIAQWRECCCIIKNIADKDTPNHLLVNKVLKYHSSHFEYYTECIINELKHRGYKISSVAYNNYKENLNKAIDKDVFNNHMEDLYRSDNPFTELFAGWHNDRYFAQCVYNLQEKFDCGGIKESEWNKIKKCARKKGVIV